MKINDISEYFEDKILKRGYNYYKEGKVISINKLKKDIIANVEGTNTYKVKISMEDKECIKMKCNCPYEYPCKHEAAVLYKLKLEEVKNSIASKTDIFNNEQELEKILNNEIDNFKKMNCCEVITEEELYLILKKYIKIILKLEDDDMKYSCFIKTVNWIRENKKSIVYLYSTLLDIEDEENYCDLEDELEFEMYLNPYKSALYENIFKDFTNILENTEYLQSYCNELEQVEEQDYLFNKEINILIFHVKNKNMAKIIIDLLKKLVKKDNNFEDYEIKILELSFKYIDSKKTIEYLKKNLYLNHLRELLVELVKDDIEEYKVVLEMIYQINNEYTPYIYVKDLADIYLKSGDIENYKKIAKVLLLKESSYSTYLHIKELYLADEWNTIKFEYIDCINKEDLWVYVMVLLEEKMYNEAFEYLRKYDIYAISKFITILLEINPKKAYILYKNAMIKKMKVASAYYEYQEVKEYLINSKLYISDEKIIDIINTFIKKYPKKTELISELEFYRDTYL